MYCPYCYAEVGGIGGGDEFIDYCDDCDTVVEGNTLFSHEVLKLFEDEMMSAANAWRLLIDKPSHTLKWKRDFHLAEARLKRCVDDVNDWQEIVTAGVWD